LIDLTIVIITFIISNRLSWPSQVCSVNIQKIVHQCLSKVMICHCGWTECLVWKPWLLVGFIKTSRWVFKQHFS